MSGNIYAPIDSASLEMRLLHLHPDTHDQVIRCNLHHVSLHEQPYYETLSYCWGSSEDKPIIQLNGNDFHVTQNLYAALQRIRHPQQERTLWIDALCINQDDVAERETQVLIMRHIYSKTACGMIWLGDEPETSQSVVSIEQREEIDKVLQSTDALKLQSNVNLSSLRIPPISATQAISNDQDPYQITKSHEVLQNRGGRDLVQLEKAKDDSGLHVGSIFHAFCLLRMLAMDVHLDEIPYLVQDSKYKVIRLISAHRALHYIMNRPWFSRIWTVQECMLPSKSIVLFGPFQAPWKMFTDAAYNFQRHQHLCCAGKLGTNNMLDFLVNTVEPLRYLSIEHAVGLELTLLSLLREFRYRHASEPKDKVYGLLPLVTNWCGMTPIVPHYDENITPSQVFTQTTYRMIETTQSLDVLCLPKTPVHSFTSVPSWVPGFFKSGFTSSTELRRPFRRLLNLYDAAACSKAQVDIIEENVLVLEGVPVDSVAYATETIHSWLGVDHGKVYRQCYNFTKSQKVDKRMTDWTESFVRTLCTDVIYVKHRQEPHSTGQRLFRRVTPDDVNDMYLWCLHNNFSRIDTLANQANLGADISNNIARVTLSVETFTTGQRLIITNSGHPGLAPSNSNPSIPVYADRDEIFVFPGGKMPFILRPVGERHVPQLGLRLCYSFVGECYLHGFMDGQAMTDFEEKKTTIYLI